MPNQPACAVCGRIDYLLVDKAHTIFACADHVLTLRSDTFGYRYTTFEPYESWVSITQTPRVPVPVPFDSRKETKKTMAAKDKTEAQKEGKTFAVLLGALVQKRANPDFEQISDFASYYAQNIVGYQDAERANGWTKGFIAGWLAAETTDPDGLQLDTVNLLRKALGMAPLDPEKPLLPEAGS